MLGQKDRADGFRYDNVSGSEFRVRMSPGELPRLTALPTAP